MNPFTLQSSTLLHQFYLTTHRVVNTNRSRKNILFPFHKMIITVFVYCEYYNFRFR